MPERIWIELQDVPNNVLKVMTWNILSDACCDGKVKSVASYETDAKKACSWEHRLDLIVEEIRTHDRHVVALQEVSSMMFRTLSDKRSQFGYEGDFGNRGWSGYAANNLSPEQQQQARDMEAQFTGNDMGDYQDGLPQWSSNLFQGGMDAIMGNLGFQGDTLSGANLQPYQNPYQQQVTDATMGEMGRQNEIQMDRLGDSAQQAGAFGATVSDP